MLRHLDPGRSWKLSWEPWIVALDVAARDTVSIADYYRGQWWGFHWKSSLFAVHLHRAVGGFSSATSPKVAKIFAAAGPAASSAVTLARRHRVAAPASRPYSIQKDIYNAVIANVFKVDVPGICATRWERIAGILAPLPASFHAALCANRGPSRLWSHHYVRAGIVHGGVDHSRQAPQ